MCDLCSGSVPLFTHFHAPWNMIFIVLLV